MNLCRQLRKYQCDSCSGRVLFEYLPEYWAFSLFLVISLTHSTNIVSWYLKKHRSLVHVLFIILLSCSSQRYIISAV